MTCAVTLSDGQCFLVASQPVVEHREGYLSSQHRFFVAGLGRSLDIKTTAEGVETMEQLMFLRTAGCQLAQGYLFSRPVPASKLNFDRPDVFRRGAKVA